MNDTKYGVIIFVLCFLCVIGCIPYPIAVNVTIAIERSSPCKKSSVVMPTEDFWDSQYYAPVVPPNLQNFENVSSVLSQEEER